MAEEKQFEFSVTLVGYGRDKEDAWGSVREQFALGEVPIPEDEDTIERDPGDFKVD